MPIEYGHSFNKKMNDTKRGKIKFKKHKNKTIKQKNLENRQNIMYNKNIISIVGNNHMR